MSTLHSSPVKNLLLSTLPLEELAKFSRELETIDLPKGFLIAAFDGPIEHIYFPDSGIGSIVAISPEGNRAEAGMFGREGFSPVQAAVGAHISPHEIIMQGSGSGHRMGYSSFLDAIKSSPPFADVIACYSQALAIQVTYTALSNVSHPVDERLARWLLMCHDRVDGDELNLTHEYIALMLAVRRPSVTTALHVLEGNRFIRAERGCITIRDRGALEEFARDAYGRPEREYARLHGGNSTSNVVPLAG